MENLPKVVSMRLTLEEHEALQAEAKQRDRKIGWIAREKLREAMKL